MLLCGILIIMKLLFVFTGQTSDKSLEGIMADYAGRIKHYSNVEVKELKTRNEKNESIQSIKEREQIEQMKRVDEKDFLILLDENGRQFSSVEFAREIEKLPISSNKRIIFMTGGAYGFGEEIIKRANMKISFSKLTFTHQLIRVLLLEQVYRAFTIIRNQKYHH